MEDSIIFPFYFSHSDKFSFFDLNIEYDSVTHMRYMIIYSLDSGISVFHNDKVAIFRFCASYVDSFLW